MKTNTPHTPNCKRASGHQTQFDLDCQRCNKDSYDSVTALRPVAEKYFQKHTPTPYELHSEENAFVLVAPWSDQVRPGEFEGYGDYRGGIIARIEHQGIEAPVVTARQAKANGEFIRRAVNSHEELLEALETNYIQSVRLAEILESVKQERFDPSSESLEFYITEAKRAVEDAKQAIAKAEGLANAPKGKGE